MEWIKLNWLTLLIVLFLGFLVLKSLFPGNSSVVNYKIERQLDSAKALIVEKTTENKILIREKEEAEKEKLLLIESIQEQLGKIQPKYSKIISDFNKAPPDQKKKFVNEEFLKRKQEMEKEK